MEHSLWNSHYGAEGTPTPNKTWSMMMSGDVPAESSGTAITFSLWLF